MVEKPVPFETALAHLGGLFGGASSVPVNFHLTADETGYILKDSESKILFIDDKTAELEEFRLRKKLISTSLLDGTVKNTKM